MTPMPEQIKELREYALDENLPPDFITLLADYEKVKAENERLTDMLRAAKETVLDTRKQISENIELIEKVKAENERRQKQLVKEQRISADLDGLATKFHDAAKKAVADLEAARPLIEAAKLVRARFENAVESGGLTRNRSDALYELCAALNKIEALALRQSKEKGE